jgi:DNA invertase Pin-like site-specific DNA recombinase
VSHQKQVAGTGYDRQLDTVKAFCKQAGFKIAGVYKEAHTGTEADRPEFSKMIAEILRNGVKIVVIESQDRLARDLMIQTQLLAYLTSKNIILYSASTGDNVTESIERDPMRKAMVQIQGVFAELEKNLLVRKLRKARDKMRKETGKCEGRKSYTELSPKLLKEIKRLRRRPRTKGKKRLTYQQVCERLNDAGYRTADGKLFTVNNLKVIAHRYLL